MLYLDFYDLFERFSIMTVDGHLSDNQAFNYLKDKTTSKLYKQLVDKVMEIEIG